jgi:hypothetical protein
MNLRRFLALTVLLATAAFADEIPQRYADARAMWEKAKDRVEYQGYATEFAQFNNHFHLDEKGGCHLLHWALNRRRREPLAGTFEV